MSKVLIGVAAAIVLAGAVFAIMHFSHGPAPVASSAKNGWTPLKNAPGARDPGLVATFGAWRLVCREVRPGSGRRTQGTTANNLPPTSAASAPKRRCAIALLMRNQGVPKEWLNLRFQRNPGGEGFVVVIFYAHGHAKENFVSMPSKRPDEIDIRTDKSTDNMTVDRCVRGICMTIGDVTQSGLDSIVSAHTLVIRLPATKSAKAAEMHVPTDGLKAAFAALRREPA